ncbi:hypothetical protein EC2726800_2001 [Escherichia coli 2726800]|nr:hypothetical protein [Escherichia coli]EMX78967.1 hypothetical protein EC2726800_2001 [Escherichia coli 2726800]END46441.1 hypothetical protein EC2854350_5113 [Escherichia coli 2854350]
MILLFHLTVTPRSLMPLAYFWSYSPFASQVNNLFEVVNKNWPPS